MKHTIFYSWQADAPERSNRAFIRDCLEDAAAAISTNAKVEPSPRVDSGMEGVCGTPEVASVMFQKIDKCAVFVGDMTLVGAVEPLEQGKERKRVPNPNVLLEMGYAACRIGWQRVICVMNDHFGKRAELPFDVRNRRFPINYAVNPDDMGRASKEKIQLTKWLKFAIESVEANEIEYARQLVSRLDVNCHTLARVHGDVDYFAAPDPRRTTIGSPLDTAKFSAAVLRMLDLGLLEANFDPRQNLYAYHWTFTGIQALIILQIRQPPQHPQSPPPESENATV